MPNTMLTTSVVMGAARYQSRSSTVTVGRSDRISAGTWRQHCMWPCIQRVRWRTMRPTLVQALLRHLRLGGERVAPAEHGQPQPEVEVLGEALAPRFVAEVHQGGEAGELPVAAEADAPDVLASALGQRREGEELVVLEAGQPAEGAVEDAHLDLHGTDGRIGEARLDRLHDVGAQPAVAVDDAQHDRPRVDPGGEGLIAHHLEGVVEGSTLAQPCLGEHPAQQHDPVGRIGPDDVSRLVVRAVVDDEDAGEVALSRRAASRPCCG